jgi:hypothetical protein
MSDWIVEIRKTYTWRVKVQAKDYGDSKYKAEKIANPPCAAEIDTVCHPIMQLGEPWVSGGWYDLHGPGDVVVMNRAYGNLFTLNEINLIIWRLEKLGLQVVDSWNITNSSQASFRCKGRKGTKQFTKKQLRFLCF